MKEEIFLTYNEFWKNVGEKRSHSKALTDINMLTFNNITYNPISDEYTTNIQMKTEHQKGYMTNPYLIKHNLIIMENIHLIHWAEWLNIGIMTKLHPELMKYFFLVTRVKIVLDEPTFLDQPMIYKMKIFANRKKKKKHKFTFINQISNWVHILVDYVILEEQFNILEHYHKKHQKKKDSPSSHI